MIQQPKSLTDLVDQLRRLFESKQVDIDEVKRLMASYQSNPSDWIDYAEFNQYRYTRNLVDTGNGKYNLMLLCWPQKIKSQIHDHADAHCIMKNLAGTLYEVRFRWPEECGSLNMNNCAHGMEKIAETRLDSENSVAYINDSIGLHRVENRDDEAYAVTLHLYCPPFSQCHTFDENTGVNKVVNMTFDNQPKQPVYTVRKISSSANLMGEPAKEMLVFEQSR